MKVRMICPPLGERACVSFKLKAKDNANGGEETFCGDVCTKQESHYAYGRLGRLRVSRVEGSTDVEDEPVVGGVVGRRPSMN
jgi:hypothetical protein